MIEQNPLKFYPYDYYCAYCGANIENDDKYGSPRHINNYCSRCFTLIKLSAKYGKKNITWFVGSSIIENLNNYCPDCHEKLTENNKHSNFDELGYHYEEDNCFCKSAYFYTFIEPLDSPCYSCYHRNACWDTYNKDAYKKPYSEPTPNY